MGNCELRQVRKEATVAKLPRRCGYPASRVYIEMSSYLVLARKLRPRTFDEVVGQGYIVKALGNAARSGKIAHALLFTGPRGVGKTSTARIVAKAVNCEKPNAEDRPCGSDPCDYCSLISDGRAVEVQEMDAASHTSVNDVRDIIEQSRYLPASGKQKIYIIDEAHMLSQAAFNALLKTLEEPPGHVLFILATTEPHKIPATILSRCQRYDFRKVSVTEINSSLEAAAKSEKIKIAPETLSAIALEADGSLRDALSLLDQLAATFGAEINHTEALALLGFVDANIMNTMFEAIMKRDAAKGIETLRSALDKGIRPAKFAEGVASLLRIAVTLKVGGEKAVPDIPAERASLLLDSARDSSAEDLEMLFDIALEACDRVGRSFYPEMAVEAMALKLCSVEKAVPLDEIMHRLRKLTDGKVSSGRSEEPARSPERKTKTAERGGEGNGKPVKYGTDSGGGKNAEGFADFLSEKEDFGYMAHLVRKCDIRVGNSVAEIKVEKDSVMQTRLSTKKELRTRFLREAESFFGRPAKIEVSDTAPRPEQGNGIEKIRENPIVRQALEMFDGKIQNLSERKTS